jgi:hypothetical protein
MTDSRQLLPTFAVLLLHQRRGDGEMENQSITNRALSNWDRLGEYGCLVGNGSIVGVLR